jgi:Uma2 family endonuclease
MIRLGVIPERGGVVLIEGYLVQTMSTNPPHISTLNRLRKRLDRLLPAGWDSRIQGPITLERSEPEPDYVVVRGGDADYTARHPGPADIGLLVEVADTSVEVDRADQQQLYAKAGVPVYWIVNIPERQIEVYTDPQPSADPPAYANRQDFKPGDAVSVTLDGTAVAAVPVAELLP